MEKRKEKIKNGEGGIRKRKREELNKTYLGFI
jgi:hypothetical protein